MYCLLWHVRDLLLELRVVLCDCTAAYPLPQALVFIWSLGTCLCQSHACVYGVHWPK